ncbi:helix-turn-helix domain-containing protein [Persicimonas caeni]|nr:helix-turn-helix domain-containing protein [Persicimonas caeni]
MGRPAKHIQLAKEQINELHEFYHHAKVARERTRAQIVLLAGEQGLSAPEIARLVNMSQQTVGRWIARYLDEGIDGFADRPRTGAPSKVTEEFVERLIEVVRHRPRALDQSVSTWTLEHLAEFMAEEFDIEVSGETIRRHLADNGIVLRRPQHKITSPDPLYRVKKRRLKPPEKT